MLNNFIDEVALLKAFIDHGTLSYPEVQEKGIVPPLKKQEHRAMFKHTIDKFRRWNVIDIIPDSDPKAWAVVPERACEEYDRLVIEIERKQIVEKYSFEAFQEELQLNSRKLKKIKLFKALAVSGFVIAVFHFVTGLSLLGLFGALKHFIHGIMNHGH